jgi:hypothetical protein
LAWFNFSIFAGDKSWVAGVELATASEPPARKPRIWGRHPSGVDPSHSLRCNLLLNLASPRQQSSLGKEKRPAFPSVLLVGRTETTGRLLRAVDDFSRRSHRLVVGRLFAQDCGDDLGADAGETASGETAGETAAGT